MSVWSNEVTVDVYENYWACFENVHFQTLILKLVGWLSSDFNKSAVKQSSPLPNISPSGKSMPLTEVEGEHVSKMTDKEKELYDQKYRDYCDSIMMWNISAAVCSPAMSFRKSCQLKVMRFCQAGSWWWVAGREASQNDVRQRNDFIDG